MKKPLYIILLAVEAVSLLFPLFFILYFHGMLVSALLLLAIAGVYAFFGIRASRQKKAEDEAEAEEKEDWKSRFKRSKAKKADKSEEFPEADTKSEGEVLDVVDLDTQNAE